MAFGSRPVFRDLSCRFPKGRVSCILGGSGSGKSTALKLVAGITKPTAGTVQVRGRIANRAVSFPVAVSLPESRPDNGAISRLWARNRIGELTRQIRLEGASPALVERVRDLGLRYGIITEYTSYLVQEPGVGLERPMPAGAAMAREMTGAQAFDAAKASTREQEEQSQVQSLLRSVIDARRRDLAPKYDPRLIENFQLKPDAKQG